MESSSSTYWISAEVACKGTPTCTFSCGHHHTCLGVRGQPDPSRLGVRAGVRGPASVADVSPEEGVMKAAAMGISCALGTTLCCVGVPLQVSHSLEKWINGFERTSRSSSKGFIALKQAINSVSCKAPETQGLASDSSKWSKCALSELDTSNTTHSSSFLPASGTTVALQFAIGTLTKPSYDTIGMPMCVNHCVFCF
eukprot:scaffold304_cov409-Prasinococcus_capsulatus_cf.AAC.12